MNKKTFLILWLLCLIGSWSLIPYLYYLKLLIPSPSLLLIATMQSALLFGVVCWISSRIIPKTDLRPFQHKNILRPAIISGALVGITLFLSDQFLFQSPLSEMSPPFWVGALASLYGAINEEVLLRLFLFSLIYLILNKTVRRGEKSHLLWSANILVALLFGLGHLPAAFKLMTPSGLEIFRILFLNGIAGLMFGWLYWSRGLWAATIAHFIADLILHAFLI